MSVGVKESFTCLEEIVADQARALLRNSGLVVEGEF
jgi:hypothetical protein